MARLCLSPIDPIGARRAPRDRASGATRQRFRGLEGHRRRLRQHLVHRNSHSYSVRRLSPYFRASTPRRPRSPATLPAGGAGARLRRTAVWGDGLPSGVGDEIQQALSFRRTDLPNPGGRPTALRHQQHLRATGGSPHPASGAQGALRPPPCRTAPRAAATPAAGGQRFGPSAARLIARPRKRRSASRCV
jgi:hypothetical protein